MLPSYRVSEGEENGILFLKKGENWKERERGSLSSSSSRSLRA